MLNPLFLLALTLTELVSGAEYRITSVDEFTNFANDVNDGVSNYSGTTVLLDADLSLSEVLSFEPIGKNEVNYFLGTFDGQGHTINGLKISSSSTTYTGLFGFSSGLSIRNLVLDSSCSFINSFTGSSTVHIGEIIGYCVSNAGECIIENTVSMGSVTFNGNISANYAFLFFGGVIGYLDSYSTFNSFLTNCANYGSITHSGTSFSSSIGGIVGVSINNLEKYVQNCANYGTITYNGALSDSLYIGGIVGHCSFIHIENCLSSGKITANGDTQNIGSLVGYIASDTQIINSYFTSDSGVDKVCGDGTPSNLTGTPSASSTVDTTLVNSLNNQITPENGWNRWIMLDLNGGVMDFLSQEVSVVVTGMDLRIPTKEGITFLYWYVNSNVTDAYDHSVTDISRVESLTARWGENIKVTLRSEETNFTRVLDLVCGMMYGDLPTLSKEGFTFVGWFTEDNVEMTNESIIEIPNDHTLYAKWTGNNYTITFNTMGGSVTLNSKKVTFNGLYGDLPTPTKEGFSFVGWFTEDNVEITNENIIEISNDHTLYGKWTGNNYTITFNTMGGSVTPTSKTLTFNGPYGDLPIPTRDNYEFAGWSTENNESVTSESVVVIPNNHTLYAQWKEIPTKQVEIVFGTKDLSDEEIRGIIGKYAKSEFTIFKIENEDELMVIVEFVDAEKAVEFVKSIGVSRDREVLDKIKRVGFTTREFDNSYSLKINPLPLLLFSWGL